MPQADEPGRERVQVRSPLHPPTLEETLLDPRQGHVAPPDEQLRDGAALRRLVVAQRRMGIGIGAGFALLVLGTFLMLETTDWGAASLAGVPLSWLVPGCLLTPSMLLIGWWYQRISRRHEAEFLSECRR